MVVGRPSAHTRRMPDTKRNPRYLAAIGVALIAAAALAVLAAPASAATYNRGYARLVFPPLGSYYEDRVLTLHGRYVWGVFGGNLDRPRPTLQTRTVRLIGRYRMLDRIVPYGRSYRHYAQFVNLRTGGKVQQIQTLNDGEGVYYWGSKISNVRARR